MNLLSRDELQRLIQIVTAPCVSLYMPTHRAGAEVQQDPIRLKNLIHKTEQKLEDYGLRSSQIQDILRPVNELQTDWSFWQYQANSLVIFLTPEQMLTYSVPINFEEEVTVGEHFYLKPLLPLLSGDGRFYVLALSQNEVRLFQGGRYSLNPMNLNGISQSMDETLRLDQPEPQLQYHTGRPAGPSRREAIYHGHGGGEEDNKENLQRFLRQVAKGLQQILREERVPLILAGVDYLFPIYHEVNAYSYLLGEGITGNPENISLRELHEQAWQIVEPYFLQGQQEAVEQYQQLAKTKRASGRVEEIIPAAHFGRIETLLVAVGPHCWGEYNPATNTLQLHAEQGTSDQDLLDTVAIQTLLKGGQVYAVDPDKMPGALPLAALFRYW